MARASRYLRLRIRKSPAVGPGSVVRFGSLPFRAIELNALRDEERDVVTLYLVVANHWRQGTTRTAHFLRRDGDVQTTVIEGLDPVAGSLLDRDRCDGSVLNLPGGVDHVLIHQLGNDVFAREYVKKLPVIDDAQSRLRFRDRANAPSWRDWYQFVIVSLRGLAVSIVIG